MTEYTALRTAVLRAAREQATSAMDEIIANVRPVHSPGDVWAAVWNLVGMGELSWTADHEITVAEP